jgi:ABC-type polysaccharide/polyol phosphate export permease
MSITTHATPDRGRLTLAETIADSQVMAARQLRKLLRRPTYIVHLFVQPVIFVLLFRHVFGGAINTGRDPESVQSAGLIWVLPLVFASSAFVSTASMPGVVHRFADVNPVTLTVNAARALTIGHGHALAPALGTLAWLVGLLLVFVPLSVRAFRRA